MHVILWEFTIKPESQQAFLRAYGPNGDWATLFRKAEGYKGTELLQSEAPNTFVTIDRWDTSEDFERFKVRFQSEYQQLDIQFETLTVSERKLGTFTALQT